MRADTWRGPFLVAVALGVLAVAGNPRAALAAETVPGKLGPRLASAILEGGPRDVHLAWVFLADKGEVSARAHEPARSLATPRALARRALRGSLASPTPVEDLPLRRDYVAAVSQRALRVRHELRWLNALSVAATADGLREIGALPFVTRLDLVRRFRRAPEPLVPWEEARSSATAGATRVGAIDYGTSLGQLQQIGVPAVHDLGLHGEGVVVALFDSGFDTLAHQAFETTSILAMHDFVNGDDDVGDGTDLGKGSHGTATLSVLGGYRPGQLVGPAFAASFLLAKTENTESETPAEEDNWAAAAEWAEALGADVVSSSLSYLDFDQGHASYTPAEMDGRTAISTRAAELLAAHGVVVVNSASNSGFNAEHNTLGAPADGARVIAAAAVGPTGQRASFSSVGPSADGRIKPDLAAQGQAVKVAASGVLDAYRSTSGTSFSCPLIAGVAALVLQAHPDYTVDEVIAVLKATASQAAAPDNLLGWGIVDAFAAVTAPRP
jgi:subtilisin family serine protease